MCTGYEVDGELHDGVPGRPRRARAGGAAVRVVRRVEDARPPTRARSTICRREARAYLDRIEELVETPITYVSVGTRRDQIIGVEGVVIRCAHAGVG